MKNTLLILSLIAVVPTYGMQKEYKRLKREPLENPHNVKRKYLIVINNTLQDHTIRIGHHHHKHRVKFADYKIIETSTNSINIDGKRDYKLDPKKKFFYLGTPLEDHAALYHPAGY